MAMTSTPTLYASGGNNIQQRNPHHRNSQPNYSSNGTDNSSSHQYRKSAVELLAESKAFYVKSETVRGRTQTLPLSTQTRARHRTNTVNERCPNLQSGIFSATLRDLPSTVISNSTLNRRSTGNTSAISHQSNADMLQNALRKLLDCGSPVTSIENVAGNQSSSSISHDMRFDMEYATPISPPAEYALCGSASDRRYATRSLSHSQPVSASSTISGETSSSVHRHENGCCSTHLVILAKSLPDLHTTRNLSSSFEGSRSNKSITSDVFSLNRDSGGDSSGHLTHKSEPLTSRRQTHISPICLGTGGNNLNDSKQWTTSTPVNSGGDLRRDSGSSTQHSGSYYHGNNYYDKYNYDPKPNFHISSYSQEHLKNSQPKCRSPGNNVNCFYEKNSPNSFHEGDMIYRQQLPPPPIPSNHTSSYFCRYNKHGYPIPLPVARVEVMQSSNDQKLIMQNVRNMSSSSSSGANNTRNSNTTSSSSSSNKLKHRNSSAAQIERTAPVLGQSKNQLQLDSPTQIILPPPIECSEDSFFNENIVFMDTIIPPPMFEMENEVYESLEHKHVTDPKCDYYNKSTLSPPRLNPNNIHEEKHKSSRKDKYFKSSSTICDKEDNISDSSFHENVAPTQMTHSHKNVYRQLDSVVVTTTTTTHVVTTKTNIVAEQLPSSSHGTASSLPYIDPELSPGLGTFKRQKCFRYKHKSNGSSNSNNANCRPILRSKSDISDRCRRKSQPSSTGNLIRKSCGGEISRSVSHLEQFFEQLGLNSDAYDNIFIHTTDSDSDSPVYFSDVSTVDSNRPLPPLPADTTDGGNHLNNNPNNEGCLDGIIANNAGPTPIGTNNIFRSSSDQPSIVERNARIIKWLCNCRKAQLAFSTQAK